MIKSIRLVNWRSHSDTKLTFHKGTNLLVGIMGAGKSSILEAISFALFGTFPAIERRKLKIDNIVRLNEQSAKAILEFEWDGTTYKIERAIERTKKGISTSAEIYKDNSLAEHGQVAVTTYIKNLISVDYDLFTRAIYSEQNNLDYFLNLDPRRRREEIDTLLGLDKFEVARSNSVTVINQIHSKRQTLSGQFSSNDLQETEEKEKLHLSTINLTQSKLTDTDLQINDKSKALDINSKSFDSMKKDKENFEKLDREVLKLTTRIESLKKELDGKQADCGMHEAFEKKISDLTSSRVAVLDEIKLVEQKQNSLSKELGSIESQLKNIAQVEKTIASANKELKTLLQDETIDSLNQKLTEANQKVLSFSAEKSSTEREIREINDLMPKLQDGASRCPLCLSELGSHSVEHIKAEKARILSEKNSLLKELSSAITVATNSTKSLTTNIKTAVSLSDKLTVLKTEPTETILAAKASLEHDLTATIEKKKHWQAKLDSLSSELESAKHQLKDILALISKKSDMESTAKTLEAVQAQLSAIRFDAGKFDALQSQINMQRLEMERLLASKKTLEAELHNSNELLKLLRERIAKAKSTEAELASLAKLEEELSIYKNALLETQTALRLNLIDAINNAMTEVWPIFYPYKNYHTIRLGVSEKDYIFEVSDGSSWKPLEAAASGGERACAALALRVAFAMVLTPNLSWLILDEPTHNLDSEAVSLLSSTLQYKVPEVVGQTFIITHDEAFMGSEFASSYRLGRDKGNNGETKVEKS